MNFFPLEIYGEISTFISSGSDWKSWIFVCKSFNSMNNTHKINQFSNHLATLIKLFPEKIGVGMEYQEIKILLGNNKR